MLQGFAMLIEEKDGTGLLKEETGALVSPLCFDVIALSSLFTSSFATDLEESAESGLDPTRR